MKWIRHSRTKRATVQLHVLCDCAEPILLLLFFFPSIDLKKNLPRIFVEDFDSKVLAPLNFM